MAGQELEARLRCLEDIEAIKKLKYAYCRLYDLGDWQGVADLFTEDAVGHFGELGHCEGKGKIAEFVRNQREAVWSFMYHMVLNPVIEVSGDKASGIWYAFVPVTHGVANQALWIATIYEDEYVKRGGEWKFEKLWATELFFTTFEEGWARMKRWDQKS